MPAVGEMGFSFFLEKGTLFSFLLAQSRTFYQNQKEPWQ